MQFIPTFLNRCFDLGDLNHCCDFHHCGDLDRISGLLGLRLEVCTFQCTCDFTLTTAKDCIWIICRFAILNNVNFDHREPMIELPL